MWIGKNGVWDIVGGDRGHSDENFPKNQPQKAKIGWDAVVWILEHRKSHFEKNVFKSLKST